MHTCDEIKPKKPHFFKIILAETLSQGKIGISKRYVREYGNELLSASSVLLKLPDGIEWKLGLTRSDGVVWIQNGWLKFAEYYRLTQGSFLVFKFNGSCRFKVTIFDLTTSEIDYPHPQGNNINQEIPQEKVKDDVDHGDDDADDDDDDSDDGGDDNDNADDGDDDDDVDDDGDNDSIEIIDEDLNETEGHKDQRIRNTSREKALALERAKDFKSNNPFFMVVMYNSYVGHRQASTMVIPAEFARKYTSMRNEEAHLCLSGESEMKIWNVRYHCWRSRNLPNACFRNGWRAFVRANHLKVEDVCVFELMASAPLLFQVTIYRV